MLRILLASFLALAAAAWHAVGIEHGSLVVAMPVASGWVVCGDTRKNSTLFEATDDEVKVFELGKGVVAGATGLRRVKEGATLFDVADRVQAFVRTRAF